MSALNTKTQDAINEIEAGNSQRFSTVAELIEDLQTEHPCQGGCEACVGCNVPENSI